MASSTRIAIVTGGAQGIGRSIILHLAQDGLDVAIADLPSKLPETTAVMEEIKQSTGRTAIFVPTNVSDKQAVESLVDDVVKVFGCLDVMVANAAFNTASNKPDGHTIVNADITGWEALWRVNINGVLFCYKYAARQMIKQGQGGRLIGASSMAARQAVPGLCAYTVSKFAGVALTQLAALKFKEHNITVNAYAPRIIDTPLVRATAPDPADPFGHIKKAMNLPANAAVGQPQDIASLVSYLAGPDSSYMTGQTIGINGGIRLD